jgi:uncharacterized membrane protein
MPEAMRAGLEAVTRALEIVGAGALVVGFVVATGYWLLAMGRKTKGSAVDGYRHALGRVILIGLEILVAATIIKTATFHPTLESMGLLAIMVVIRTILGWATVLEMSGRWPWQRTQPEAGGPEAG